MPKKSVLVSLPPETVAACDEAAVASARADEPVLVVKDGEGRELIRLPHLFKHPTRGERHAVCSTWYEDADLVITPHDDDDVIITLVQSKTGNTCELKGWITAAEGRRIGYWIGEFAFVPQHLLKDPRVFGPS
jgi:hypothetical protein